MKPFRNFVGALAVLIMASGVTVFAAGMNVEGTPAPTPPKPDFSTIYVRRGRKTLGSNNDRRSRRLQGLDGSDAYR